MSEGRGDGNDIFAQAPREWFGLGDPHAVAHTRPAPAPFHSFRKAAAPDREVRRTEFAVGPDLWSFGRQFKDDSMRLGFDAPDADPERGALSRLVAGFAAGCRETGAPSIAAREPKAGPVLAVYRRPPHPA